MHFREPGWEHKEDLETGSRAALLGGVTTFFEMPNTNPATTTSALLEDKLKRAAGRSWVNYGFFIGAARENIANLAELERIPGCVGVKVFVGSSTGSLLIEDHDEFVQVMKSGQRRVAVHCEEQARLKERKSLLPSGASPELHPVWRDEASALMATQRVVEVNLRFGRPVHILHVTSKAEINFLAEVKSGLKSNPQQEGLITCEVTPNHLLFSAPECYREKGTLVQMNPPIREKFHCEALWEALRSGVVDVMGSDHAPHTLEEKAKPYPESPSGMPGVQTIVPLMLDQVNKKNLSMERLVDLLAVRPAQIYGYERKGRIEVGCDADLTFVDMKLSREITRQWLASRCGWSPFEGWKTTGWPVGALVSGRLALWDSQIVGTPQGQPVK